MKEAISLIRFKNFVLRSFSFVSLLLFIIPFNNKASLYFTPHFDVALLFYWTIYKPRIFSTIVILLFGFFQDMLYGLDLGISSLTNICAQFILLSQRRIFIRTPFTVIWFGFAIFALMTIVIKLAIISFSYNYFISSNLIFTQLMVTIFAYPLFHSLLNYISKLAELNIDHA